MTLKQNWTQLWRLCPIHTCSWILSASCSRLSSLWSLSSSSLMLSCTASLTPSTWDFTCRTSSAFTPLYFDILFQNINFSSDFKVGLTTSFRLVREIDLVCHVCNFTEIYGIWNNKGYFFCLCLRYFLS